MAIGVGAGDYAEYLPFVPPPGGGPAVLFIGGGFPPGNDYAIDTDNLVFVSESQNTTDSDTTRSESTDGSGLTALLASDNTTWESRPFTGSSTTSPAALPGLLNVLIFIFRDGAYRILVFENSGPSSGLGGEYSSPDGLAPWTKTGRVNEKDFGTGHWPADLWCATEDHAYYVMREDDSFSGLHRSIYCDSEVGLSPTVYRLEYPAPADSPPWEPPTGGTFILWIDDGTMTPPTTNPIAWNASAATILSELNSLPAFGAGGSASGSFATHIEITDPNNGFKPGLIIDDSLLTSAGPDTPAIFTSIETQGQNGVGTFVTDASVGTPVYSFDRMWGSFSGDVAIIIVRIDGDRKVWKLEGTASPVDVTPGFFNVDGDFDLCTSPDGVTWMATYEDELGGHQLARSTDGGDTWSLVGPTAFYIFAISFDPGVANRWWAFLDVEGSFTQAQLHVSTDNGATWSDFGADPYFYGGNERIIPLGGRTY